MTSSCDIENKNSNCLGNLIDYSSNPVSINANSHHSQMNLDQDNVNSYQEESREHDFTSLRNETPRTGQLVEPPAADEAPCNNDNLSGDIQLIHGQDHRLSYEINKHELLEEVERGFDLTSNSFVSNRDDNSGASSSKSLTNLQAAGQQSQQLTRKQVQIESTCEEVKQIDLFGVRIVALSINGKDRLCLAQISNTLLKNFSYNEIHNRRVALGITCVQCTPIQLEMLRRAGAMPSSSRRCGMITMREAERLCRSFLVEDKPPELPENFYFTVAHKINFGCRGRFIPARYISSRAKCIECYYCGEFFSPNKFIFHSHRQPHQAECNPPDSPNINSWRKHIDLDWTREHSQDIRYAWEDVKSLFNGGTRRKMSNSLLGQQNLASRTQSLTTNNPKSREANDDNNNNNNYNGRPDEFNRKFTAQNYSDPSDSPTSIMLLGNRDDSDTDDQNLIDVESDSDLETTRSASSSSRARCSESEKNREMNCMTNGKGAFDQWQASEEARKRFCTMPGKLAVQQCDSKHQSGKTTYDLQKDVMQAVTQERRRQSQHELPFGTQQSRDVAENHPKSLHRSNACSFKIPAVNDYDSRLEPRGSLSGLSRSSSSSSTGDRQNNIRESVLRHNRAAPGQSLKFNGENGARISISDKQAANNEQSPYSATNLIYSQLYAQLMQSNRPVHPDHLTAPAQQQQPQPQQLPPVSLAPIVDTQLALKHHLWSSLLASFQCNPPPGQLFGHIPIAELPIGLNGPPVGSLHDGLLAGNHAPEPDIQTSLNQLKHLFPTQEYPDVHQSRVQFNKMITPNQDQFVPKQSSAYMVHKFPNTEADEL